MDKLAKLNLDQMFINTILANGGSTTDQRMINVAQYIHAACNHGRPARDDNDATEYDKCTLYRGKYIQNWLDAAFDVDAAEYARPADELQDLLLMYFKDVEYVLMSISDLVVA